MGSLMTGYGSLEGYPGTGSSGYPGAGGLPENIPPENRDQLPPGGSPAPSPVMADDGARAASGAVRDVGAGEADRAGSHIVMERIPASDDTDTLTKQTIGKMCEYIGAGARDENIRLATAGAIAKLGLGRTDPFSIAWSVFWFCKHRVKRVLDEAAMFRLGEPDQVDMLIAPAVLVQMRDAAEDCDGFTMLAAAMLAAAGVEQCIVTIACDPRDRSRWSHVFGMVNIGGGGDRADEWLPLDCSHGKGPGWMVPRRQIFRWQAWSLSGEPIDVAPPVRSSLRGYVFGPRGMGDTCTDPATGETYDCGQVFTPPADTTPPDFSTPTFGPFPQAPAPSGPGFNWNQFVAGLIGTAGRVATVATAPAGSVITPQGAVITPRPFGSLAGGGSSLLWIGAAVVGGLLLANSLGGRR